MFSKINDNPTDNHWCGFEDQIIWWNMKFDCKIDMMDDILENISSKVMDVCDRYQILVPFDTESKRGKLLSRNNFKKLDKKNWISEKRGLKQLQGSNFPFFTKLFYFDKKGELQFEHIMSIGYYFQGYENEFRCYKYADIKSIPQKVRISAQDTPLYVYYSIREDKDLCSIEFSLCTNSEIWFTHNIYANKSNEFLSYRNTPRLNSFLRELKNVTINCNGLWSCVVEPRINKIINGTTIEGFNFLKTFGDCAIPLNGEIIYQEDVDDGRVKIPEF